MGSVLWTVLPRAINGKQYCLVAIYFNYTMLDIHSLLFWNFSLKTAKLQSVKSPGDKGNLDAAIEPYRSDNAKLVKENNELHQQLIKAKEDLEVSSKGNCQVMYKK